MAQKRRREEAEWAKEQDALLTSDLSEMAMEEKMLNPIIDVSTVFRVSKKREFNDNTPRCNLADFDISDYEEHVNKEVKIRGGDIKGWRIVDLQVAIKASHSRATNAHQSLNDFSLLEWDKVV